MRQKSTHGDDTGFGFQIPSSWPKWKRQCRAPSKTHQRQCKAWAVRGMPTCKTHGSGGVRNAQLGLVRYLAWITIGVPDDTPAIYARYVSLAAALEMMFNHGVGNVEQRMRAAMWLLDVEAPPPPPNTGRPRKDGTQAPPVEPLDVRSVLSGED